MKKNIVLLNSPHRYDLSSTSCVNNEVINYNNRLKEAIRPYPNVHLLEIELSRHHFTRHGLHLNFTGKKLVSQKVATVVEHIFKTGKSSTSVEKVTLSEDNTPKTHEHNIDVITESTESALDSKTRVAFQTQENIPQDMNLTEENTDTEHSLHNQESQLANNTNSQISDKNVVMISEEINNNTEHLHHLQNSLIGNGIVSLMSDQSDSIITEAISQQKRLCPATRNTDFLWN